MSVAFTPGPWYCERRHTVFVIETATKSVANCNFQGTAGRDGSAEANARLIAAAPDLYRELQTLVKIATNYIESVPIKTHKAKAAQTLLYAAVDNADATLAKARGEQ